MNPKRAACYVRVSTGEQNTGAQESALRDYVRNRGWTLQKIYRDRGFSGSNANRPALDALMEDARRRAFDVVLVWKFDRFARSLKTLISGLELFRALKIDFVSLTEAVDTQLPGGQFVFVVLSGIAELESSLIGERVKAGLQHARSKGKLLGRPPIKVLTKAEMADLRQDRRDNNVPFRTLAEKYGVSVWTAHRLCARRRG